jgi:hypothetical protein
VSDQDEQRDEQEVDLDAPEGGDEGQPAARAGVALATRAMIRQILTASEIPDDITNKHAIDPAVFEEHPPFVFRAIVSNNNVDAYGTRMMPSTLRNFAQDATDGVSVMAGHMVDTTMPLGRTYAGKYTDGRGGSDKQVAVDSYMLTGVSGGAGQHLDDVIQHIRGGVYKDTSVGFYGGTMRCSIDGLDMIDSFEAWINARESDRDYCWHIPGIEYALVDKGGNKTGDREVAVGEIENAHLSHFGLVYDGATPGAAVVKARAMAAAGMLRPEVARFVESRYRIRLPEPRRSWQGHSSREAQEMSDDGNRSRTTGSNNDAPPAAAAVNLDPIRQAFRDSHVAPADWNGDLVELARSTGAEMERLRGLADTGELYRRDLMEDALAEGVRAFGNEFQKERYTAILKRSSIEEIKGFRDDWKAITARAGTFSHGRQTREGDEQDLEGRRDRRDGRRIPALYQA